MGSPPESRSAWSPRGRGGGESSHGDANGVEEREERKRQPWREGEGEAAQASKHCALLLWPAPSAVLRNGCTAPATGVLAGTAD